MQNILHKTQFKAVLLFLLALICFLPFMSPPIALVMGVVLTAAGLSFQSKNIGTIIKYLLQGSIVFMGFGTNLNQALETSQSGFMLTVVSVLFTVSVGVTLGKLFKVEKTTALLISCGTAICGGSAIAAISPVINAKNKQVTFALGVVFALNAVALLIFPWIGHALHMSQEAFGYWAAIAIHDTSSVVGAGAAYGAEALEIATTVKLTRALWIIPMSIVLTFTNKGKANKIKIPWFILFFVLAIVIGHLLPEMNNVFTTFSWLGKKGLVVALFLIGTSISWKDLKSAGLGAFALGLTLWLLVSTLSLWMIL